MVSPHTLSQSQWAFSPKEPILIQHAGSPEKAANAGVSIGAVCHSPWIRRRTFMWLILNTEADKYNEFVFI